LEEFGALIFMVRQLQKMGLLGMLDALAHLPICSSRIIAMYQSACGHIAFRMIWLYKSL
jgi:hypothetical protein